MTYDPEKGSSPHDQLDTEHLNPLAAARDMGSLATSERQGGVLSPENKYLLDSIGEFITHESGMDATTLYGYQRGVFYDLYDFIEAGGNRGYIKMPTGSGKTAIFSTLVEAFAGAVDNNGRSPKALVLVPNLDLIDQTVGRNGQRGFAQFGRNIRATSYDGRSKDLGGDAVVMTYQSLPGAIADGYVDSKTFDYVICDEAHNAIGPRTKEALDIVAGQNKLVIGMTATPHYDSRSVSEFFGSQIHNLELREAIETGILSPVRCFAVKSGAKIESITSRSDFSHEDLRGLVENEWRNRKALEFASSLVEAGYQGLISCVPGDSMKHAHDMAKMLEGQKIIDHNTGEIRSIRTVCITGETKDRASLYEQYERGEIDVLTSVDALMEGWDSKNAKFIINLRPTASPVLAVQRLGRVLRRSDDGRLATVIEFIDEADLGYYTVFHELGEATIEQGKIFGRQVTDRDGDHRAEKGSRTKDGLRLSEEIMRLIEEVDHVEVSRLVIDPIKKAPEDYMSFVAFGRQVGVGYNTIASIVEELGLETIKARFQGVATEALSPEQQQLILLHEYFDIKPAEDDHLSTNQFAQRHKVSRTTVIKLVEEFGWELPLARVGERRSKITGVLSPEQQAMLLEHELIKLDRPNDDEMSKAEFARNIGLDPRTLQSIVDELGLTLRRAKVGTVIAEVLTSEERELICAHEYFDIKPPPDEYESLRKFCYSYGVSRKHISGILQELDIEPLVGKRSGKVTEFISPDQQRAILERWSQRVKPAPEGFVSFFVLAKSKGTDQGTVRKIAAELGLKPVMGVFGPNKITEALSPEEQEKIMAHSFFSVGPPPPGYITLNQYIRSGGSGPSRRNRVMKAIEELNLELEVGKSMGRHVPILSPEQQAALDRVMSK